jgi:hypothetical protein
MEVLDFFANEFKTLFCNPVVSKVFAILELQSRYTLE